MAARPKRASMVVRSFDTNLLAYLWRCLANAHYIPALSSLFLMRLHQSTILGWWWLVIRAVMPTIGMIAILQHVPTLKPPGIPYGLFVVSGMVVWTIISTGLVRATRSIKQSRMVQTKLAVPKLIIVVSSESVPAFFSFVFAIVLVIAVFYYYLSSGTFPVNVDWPLMLIPLPIIGAFMLSIGIASFTSVIFLFARDARLILGVVTQLWFFFTPIIYGLNILPPGWQWAILYLNPMTSFVELFRWSLFGVGAWTSVSLLGSAIISLGLFLLGAWFLMRSEWVVREVAK